MVVSPSATGAHNAGIGYGRDLEIGGAELSRTGAIDEPAVSSFGSDKERIGCGAPAQLDGGRIDADIHEIRRGRRAWSQCKEAKENNNMA